MAGTQLLKLSTAWRIWRHFFVTVSRELYVLLRFQLKTMYD
jgi:hypothetical protein